MCFYKKYCYIFILFFVINVLTSCSLNNDNNKINNIENSNLIKENIDNSITKNETNNNKEIKSVSVNIENPFNQNGIWLKIIGLKEYDYIKTEFYTDVPSNKNNIYLVLFLELKNGTPSSDYIAHEHIKAIVDGKEIESGYLVNNPENYPTIKNDILPEETKYGFLVWEVSKDWKSIEISYTGWEYYIQAVPVIYLTPENLFEPLSYEEIKNN